MRHQTLVFQYTKEMQKIGREFFERAHRDRVRGRDTLYIDDKRKLVEAKRTGHIGEADIYVPWKGSFEKLSEETFKEMLALFDSEEERAQAEAEKKMEKIIKKITFAEPRDLKDGDTVVFRDRENPNRVGKASVEDGEISINGHKNIENHPFSFRNIRVIKSGDKAEEYFLDDATGLELYAMEANYPSGTAADRMIRGLMPG